MVRPRKGAELLERGAEVQQSCILLYNAQGRHLFHNNGRIFPLVADSTCMTVRYGPKHVFPET